MRQHYFRIRNFKGIKDIRLDLGSPPQSNVYTLVGLTESGKTTILEALHYLSWKREALDTLQLPGYLIGNPHDLIPIARRDNFTDTIEVESGYLLDEEDNTDISDWLHKEGKFQLTSPLRELVITRGFRFKDSLLQAHDGKSTWSIDIIGKKKRAKSARALTKPDDPELWEAITDRIALRIPAVLYFPNFLFEFPDRIYLEESASDSKAHQFYRLLLQDVLSASGSDLTLERHVLARAKSGERYQKQALESTLLKMGQNISKTVFEQWNRIFNRKITSREIIVSCDQDESGRWYIALRLKDASEIYAISERSLGFRWFFAFLLMTQYRGFRTAGSHVLFLLDEPASNLHPSAQSQLLQSFGKFPSTSSIIYTTHSHHMINPDWLETMFVVKNEGLSYDENVDNYTAYNTEVTVDKYRHFAAQHANQSTYFQPVLDVLQYVPSNIENIPDVVMLEGKNDYYTLRYFMDRVSSTSPEIHLMPGGGAGSLTEAIRLYLAWGRNFIVMLDSDTAGNKQKKRYEDLFGSLVQGRIHVLANIEPAWAGQAMEDLISSQDRLTIQRISYPSSTGYDKGLLNRSIQEMLLTKKTTIKLSNETTQAFTSVLRFCRDRLVQT